MYLCIYLSIYRSIYVSMYVSIYGIESRGGPGYRGLRDHKAGPEERDPLLL